MFLNNSSTLVPVCVSHGLSKSEVLQFSLIEVFQVSNNASEKKEAVWKYKLSRNSLFRNDQFFLMMDWKMQRGLSLGKHMILIKYMFLPYLRLGLQITAR